MLFQKSCNFQIQIIDKNGVSMLFAHLTCNSIKISANPVYLFSRRKLVFQVRCQQIIKGNVIDNGLKLGGKVLQAF